MGRVNNQKCRGETITGDVWEQADIDYHIGMSYSDISIKYAIAYDTVRKHFARLYDIGIERRDNNYDKPEFKISNNKGLQAIADNLSELDRSTDKSIESRYDNVEEDGLHYIDIIRSEIDNLNRRGFVVDSGMLREFGMLIMLFDRCAGTLEKMNRIKLSVGLRERLNNVHNVSVYEALDDGDQRAISKIVNEKED